MAENTDRFGLNTYSQGDTNWDHTDTVQTIDELAIERGTVADRPDSGDYDDELYLATDQQILYRWDATADDWIVEGVGSETDPLPKVWANEIGVNTLEADDAVVDDSLTATGLEQSSSPTTPIRFLGHGTESKKTEFWTVEREIDGDNEPHDLLDVEDAPTGMMVVVARRDPPSNYAFCDIVLVARSTSQSILGSQQRQDVGPRSYSNDSTMQKIAIDEPGEWYQVNVHWIGGTA